MFPPGPRNDRTLHGFLAIVSAKASHPLWRLRSVEEAYALFEANFPQADVRKCISEERMTAFISSRPSIFCPISRSDSLAFHVGKGAQHGGVVVLGEAAHCFPPDIGQGVNAAFEDVAEFAAVLDTCDEHAELGEVLREYEARRNADTSAFVRIAQVAAPYQYFQSRIGVALEIANKKVREMLAKRFPGVFHPPMIQLVYTDMPFSTILRRGNETTVRIALVAASIIATPVVGFWVVSGLGL